MIIGRTPKEKKVNLKGAVQINKYSYFVYAEENGCPFLMSGKDEKIHRNAVKNMISSNPNIKSLLKKYKIKLSINTDTLKELTGGHMNETCSIADGIYKSRSRINYG